MKRFPFKRQLIILASIIAALSIAIPVATFAHAQGNPPPGEQKRAPVHAAIATAGTPTSIVADCSSPQLLTTLNKGDVFNASATLTSTDPNEESEGETLQILDASTTPATVLLNLDETTGSATIKPFTASVNSDPIQACIVGIDSDETGTVTFTITPASGTFPNLVILLQGIDSTLTSSFANLGKIGPLLQSLPTFKGTTKFLDYSYKGSKSDGTPLPYGCALTFTNPILTDITRLNTQIANAVNTFHSTNIYLVGHSLGGVIAFGYAAFVEENLNGISLPAGTKLSAVVTLDSPLGGTPPNIFRAFAQIVATQSLGIPNYPCAGLKYNTPLPTLDDLGAIYNSPLNGGTTPPTDSGPDPEGATASILAIAGAQKPQPPLPFLPSNDFIAGVAHTNLGTAFLSIGNTHDFLWHPSSPSCVVAFSLIPSIGTVLAILAESIPDFTSTQFLEDQGDGSGHYGRAFTTPNTCAQSLGNGFNHGDVLTAANVLAGVKHFFSPVGQTPNPLIINPFQS